MKLNNLTTVRLLANKRDELLALQRLTTVDTYRYNISDQNGNHIFSCGRNLSGGTSEDFAAFEAIQSAFADFFASYRARIEAELSALGVEIEDPVFKDCKAPADVAA